VMASALHIRTAQVPLLETRQFDPHHPPQPWGRGTVSSLTAGIFWGTVGVIRELVARQTAALGGETWVVWAGGDGPLLAPYVGGEDARIEPDLVLLGLSHAAFGNT
jgi:type III pantothenate kinase